MTHAQARRAGETARSERRVTWGDQAADAHETGAPCEARRAVAAQEELAVAAPSDPPAQGCSRARQDDQTTASTLRHSALGELLSEPRFPAGAVDAAARRAASRARRRSGTAWATALIVFAGPGHEHDLAARLRARGVAVTVVDTKVGGSDHDVRRAGVGGRLLERVGRGDYDLVVAAPPCESFSVAHRPQLRSRRQKEGLHNAPPEWAAYLRKHNELAQWTAQLAQAAHQAGAIWAIENPADRGRNGSPAYWAARADHAPLWVQDCVTRLEGQTDAATQTFAYCAFGADYQKYTSIMHDAEWVELEALGTRLCEHGDEGHAELLRGRDQHGASRAARAAAYPDELNEFLAAAAATALRRRDAAAEARRSAPQAATTGRGGRVGEGWDLSPEVAAACEGARRAAPKFASERNKRATDAAELQREELPGDLHTPPSRSRPRPTASASMHANLRHGPN